MKQKSRNKNNGHKFSDARVLVCIISLVSFLTSIFIGPIAVDAAGLSAEYYDYEKVVQLSIGEKQAAVNNKIIQLDKAAYIKNGRTLVPLRFLGEALGAKVTWEGKTNTAIVEINNNKVSVTVGSKNSMINQKTTVLDVPAEIKSNRVFVPLRFIGEAFGADIDWESETQKITLALIDTTNWKLEDFGLEGISFNIPSDWTATLENGEIHIVSPLGSEGMIRFYSGKKEDYIAEVKNIAKNEGFVLEKEEPTFLDSPKVSTTLRFILPHVEDHEKDMYWIASFEQDDDSATIRDIFTLRGIKKQDYYVICTILYQ